MCARHTCSPVCATPRTNPTPVMNTHAQGIIPLLAAFRLLGGFPYAWRAAPGNAVTLNMSKMACAWTVAVVAAMVSFSLYSIVKWYSVLREDSLLQDVMLTYWSLLVMVLYLYIVAKARCLATVVRMFTAAAVGVRRCCWGVEDAPVLAAVLMVVTGTIVSLSRAELSEPNEVVSHIADRTADAAITTLLALLYALVKLVALEAEDTTRSLAQAAAIRPSWRGKGSAPAKHMAITATPGSPQRWATPHHASATNSPKSDDKEVFKTISSGAPPSGKCIPTSSTPAAIALHLLALDDILLEVVAYSGPPLLLLLLNTLCSTTMFLYKAITTNNSYYIGYITVLVGRMAQVVLIPDPLRKRRACQRLLCGLRLQNACETTLKEVRKRGEKGEEN
ncbi:hypothetical protein E2C01_031580 [Portunus trituberculatus]|uniref:Uncharacterized protein n=1 Tax=Portunus trituberculatus TaxID=210409 RepID=A0A5B7EYH7_PORTR|nr:hypothetical protein [Portunus trituberculatus]